MFIKASCKSHHTAITHVVTIDACCILGPPDKPRHVTIVARCRNSITLGWKPGLNGGSKQHFKVLYREKGKDAYQKSQDNITNLKFGQRINYTIYGLYANEYEITAVAINQFGNRSQMLDDTEKLATEGKA